MNTTVEREREREKKKKKGTDDEGGGCTAAL